MPLTEAAAKKYKDMAVLTTALSAMPTPATFRQYQDNRAALLGMPDKYHDLSYFRAFFELERFVAFGEQNLAVGPNVINRQRIHVGLSGFHWIHEGLGGLLSDRNRGDGVEADWLCVPGALALSLDHAPLFPWPAARLAA